MEEDLLTYLFSQSGVTARLGTRINWNKRPQGGALPAAILRVITDTSSYSMEGDNNLDRTRVQVDVYAEEYSTAKLAARAIDAALKSHQGTTGNTSFRGVFKDGGRDDFEASTALSQDAERYHRVSADYIVHHKST